MNCSNCAEQQNVIMDPVSMIVAMEVFKSIMEI